jgi:oxalate decarboxylase
MTENNEAGQAVRYQTELPDERLYGVSAWNSLQAKDSVSSSNPGARNAGLIRLSPNSDSSPATDHGPVSTLWHSVESTHRRVKKGGWTHQVTEREVPLSKGIAGVNMRIVGGAFRRGALALG